MYYTICLFLKKKLVLPEMEDLIIPILNSGMPDLDVLKPISTDSEATNNWVQLYLVMFVLCVFCFFFAREASIVLG